MTSPKHPHSVHLAVNDAGQDVRDGSAQSPAAPSDELRRGVQFIVGCLRGREWADILTNDPDLADLEAEVGKLVGTR